MTVACTARLRALALTAALALGWFALGSDVAHAQSAPNAPAALPTAPGAAQKTYAGGMSTAAKASLPGDSGSPLEPYLFLVILAGGGIVALVAALAADTSVRRGAIVRARRQVRHVQGGSV